MKQKIFVLYTGGTIGMRQGSGGLEPDTALVGRALAPFSADMDFDWHVCTPLIDSSAVTVQNWCDWLSLLEDRLPHYDGVLVLHGTDTMAYTANMLAFALRGLDKPVVMTGSQRPYDAQGSDAQRNLATAVAAFELSLPQVSIAFDGKLYPAVGSSKISTQTDAGFGNAHFGELAQWQGGRAWRIVSGGKETASSDGLSVLLPNPRVKVAVRTLVPGFAAQECAESLASCGADAVILQSYGHGNAPDTDDFIRAVRAFVGQGGLLLNISQVPQGCASAVYAQGDALRQAGIINGGKCNLETATALMTLAVSHNWQVDDVKRVLAEHGLV